MTLQPQLTQLENADLIRLATVDPELAYLFRHALIRDAAYSSLLRDQRRRWHLAAAEVLESTYPALAGTSELASILANHFSLAGDGPRALRYLVLAGDAAFSNYANAEAVNFYSQAVDIAGKPGAEYDQEQMLYLYSRRGRALELTSRFEAALDNYRAMDSMAVKQQDKTLELAAIMARATIHSTANMAQDLPQAASLLERASALAHDLGDVAAEANIKWTLMINNAMAGGEPEVSTRYGEEALVLARAAGQRNLMALILTDLWFSRTSAGQLDLARAGLMEGCEIAREVGNLTAVAECLLRISMMDMVAGRYDLSLAATAEATETAEATNSNDMRALTRLCGGLIYADRGDLDRAIEYSQEAIRLGEMTDNVTVLIGTCSDLGRAYALLGDVERGLALAQQAAADGRRFQLLAGWAGANVVRLRLLRGDLDGAEADMAQLLDYRHLMRRMGYVPMMWGNLGLAGIDLALARGDPAGASLLARELIEHFERTGILYLQPEARLLQARAFLALGQLDDALGALQTARAEAEALGSRRLLWPILSTLADIAAKRGDEQAGNLREQARQIVDYIAAHTPTPALRQSFLGRTEVQDLLKVTS